MHTGVKSILDLHFFRKFYMLHCRFQILLKVISGVLSISIKLEPMRDMGVGGGHMKKFGQKTDIYLARCDRQVL